MYRVRGAAVTECLSAAGEFDKAAKHYGSLLGVVFVCDDCYDDVTRQ